MKQVIYVAFLLFLRIANSGAQPFIEWQHSLGGSNNERGRSVTETSDGNILVVGYTVSNDGDVSNQLGYGDLWAIKLTASGALLWEKCLGTSGASEYGFSVSPTNDDGFIVAGYNASTSGFIFYAMVKKLDSAGTEEWSRTYAMSSSEASAHSAMQTPTGEYVAAGTDKIAGFYDYCVAKFDSAGNYIWHKHYGGSEDDQAHSMDIANDGGYIIAGMAASNNGDVTGNHGGQDFWIVKLDTAGTIEWQKCFGGGASDIAFSIKATPDGGFIAAGRAFSTNGDVTGHHGTGVNSDFWVVKMDSAGTLQWQKCLGYSGGEEAHSIFRTSNGNYIMTGPLNTNNGDVPGNRGYDDVYITCIDSSGNELWGKCAGGTAEDYGFSVAPTSDGGLVATGYVKSDNIDVTGHHGNEDLWVFKLNSNFNEINGNAYYDLNSNSVHDSAELSAGYLTIRENNTGRFTISGMNGFYSISVFDTGNFSVQPLNNLNYYITSSPQSANFTGFYQTDSLNDFAYQPSGVFNDLEITVSPVGSFRTNQNAYYMISYYNAGTTTLTPTIVFFPYSNVTYITASITPAYVNSDSVIWSAAPLAPFETGSILVTVHVDSGLPAGTLINSSVRIDPVAGDANTAGNYSAWEVFTIASFDPNEILVNRDTVFTTELSSPPYLEYIIYFQNTGNDTAFNVRVLNNLPSNLEHSSIEIVASSHPVNINFNPYAGLMEFNFNNILLPQSSVNEPASHGFVRYRIKPLTGLIAGDSIKNTAAIYFDYNAPVLTNTAVTEIVLPTGLQSLPVFEAGYLIYPNPAIHSVTIRSSSSFKQAEHLIIYDLYGRKVAEKQVPEKPDLKEVSIDISPVEPGIYFITYGKYPLGKFLKSKTSF